jgi:RND family efflux transporter MFP subunit
MYRLPPVPVVLLPLLLAACGEQPPTDAATATAPLSVRTAAVASAPEAVQLSFPAQLRARERSLLAPQISGQLLERAALGQPVQAGDVLLRLRNPNVEPAQAAADAEVRAIRAQLDKARDDHARAAALRARGLVAQEALDAARSQMDSLEASLARQRAQGRGAAANVGEQTLRAAGPGRVVRVLAEPGEFVAAGQPVIELAGDAGLEFELALPPRIAQGLAPGLRVGLVALDGRTHAAVLAGHPGQAAAQGAGAPGLVRLRFDLAPAEAGGAALAAGEPVEVQLPLAAPAGVAVPLSALRATGGVPPVHLLLLEGDRTRAVEVEPQLLLGEIALVEPAVAGALAVGALLVTEGSSSLRAGDRVRVLP